MGNESRCGHRNPCIVQVDYTNWIHSCPMKTKDTTETTACVHGVPSSQPEAWKFLLLTIQKEFVKACQDQPWNHDTCTPHRWETNGVAEGAVRRVKEGTTVAFVHRGLPDEWWGCAVECYSYLRNLQDRVADGQTTFRKSFGKIFDGPVAMPSNMSTAGIFLR